MLKQNNENRIYRMFNFIHRNIIIIIIAVVVLAGMISTIAIVRGDHKAEQETEVEVKTMHTIRFAMDRVSSLNPLASADSDTYYISQLLFSSLFRLDETLNVKPDLVKSYQTDPKEGKVSLTLKDNVKFSDGSDMTASDIRYTIDQILSIGEDSPYYAYASKIDRVEVSDHRKLTVYFENPQDAALDNLVFPIVSQYSYDEGNRVPGSGQYTISSYSPEKVLKLKPNQYYYGTKAENKIELKVVENKSRVFGLMTMDAVTAYVSRDQDADASAEDKNLKVTPISSCELEYLGFNFRNKHLAKKEVRQAVALSIDTAAVIKDNYGGAGVQSDSLYFPGFLGTENKKDAYGIDVKGASDLLRSAGYADTNEDGVLEDEKRRKVSLTILVNQNGSRVDTAQSIAEGLQEIGIQTKIKSLPWDQYREAIAEGKYDLYIGGYKLDKKSDLRMMMNRSRSTGYDSSQVFSLVNQLETCLSAKKQKEIYVKLKSMLNEELPYYCLCYKTYSFITIELFRGETVPTFFDIYRGCSQWEWDKKILPEKDEEEK